MVTASTIEKPKEGVPLRASFNELVQSPEAGWKLLKAAREQGNSQDIPALYDALRELAGATTPEDKTAASEQLGKIITNLGGELVMDTPTSVETAQEDTTESSSAAPSGFAGPRPTPTFEVPANDNEPAVDSAEAESTAATPEQVAPEVPESGEVMDYAEYLACVQSTHERVRAVYDGLSVLDVGEGDGTESAGAKYIAALGAARSLGEDAPAEARQVALKNLVAAADVVLSADAPAPALPTETPEVATPVPHEAAHEEPASTEQQSAPASTTENSEAETPVTPIEVPIKKLDAEGRIDGESTPTNITFNPPTAADAESEIVEETQYPKQSDLTDVPQEAARTTFDVNAAENATEKDDHDHVAESVRDYEGFEHSDEITRAVAAAAAEVDLRLSEEDREKVIEALVKELNSKEEIDSSTVGVSEDAVPLVANDNIRDVAGYAGRDPYRESIDDLQKVA